MGSSHRLQRALVCACLALAGAFTPGCGELLGISNPFPRATAGSAGSANQSGASNQAGATTSSEAGQAGDMSNAGAPSDTCRLLGARQCNGQLPEVCTGRWEVDESENGGEPCPTLCIAGKCAECREDERRCTGNEAQRCSGGEWLEEQTCAAYCLSGACVNPPSCAKLGERTCADTTSCCNALEVPGGSYIRDYDATEYVSKDYTATLSPFLLDRFEVTVGRFAAFVNAYQNLRLEIGAGKSLHIESDAGWQSSSALPLDRNALEETLDCAGGDWISGQNEYLNLPINCVSFYVAYAFCIWDGGRLPTEAEWNFAASGGAEQREYPWSTAANMGLDSDRAFYDQVAGIPIEVGQKPLGIGRWGHSDLAGNVAEWTLDYYSPQYPSTLCNDCLNTAEQATRSVRGGGYRFNESAQKSSARRSFAPNATRSFIGIRCARDLPQTTPNEMVTQ